MNYVFWSAIEHTSKEMAMTSNSVSMVFGSPLTDVALASERSELTKSLKTVNRIVEVTHFVRCVQ